MTIATDTALRLERTRLIDKAARHLNLSILFKDAPGQYTTLHKACASKLLERARAMTRQLHSR